MVQKKLRRGRPREYDPEAALAHILDVFWTAGYSGTSLDSLSEAAAMNRPSLYNAFGDKQQLYRAALQRYIDASRANLNDAFASEKPFREMLHEVYRRALAGYFSGKVKPRGCFMIGTALTEAPTDTDIRNELAAGLRMIDDLFEARIRAAQQKGDIDNKRDPEVLAKLASATLYYLAVRSRAGEPRATLEAFAAASVAQTFGTL